MVKGLRRFTDFFQDYRDAYVFIGGAACDVWLTSQYLRFRATKDLDMVLLVEALASPFFNRFWEFVRQGKYASIEEATGRPRFYRFRKPKTPDFPEMIELLCRNHLNLPAGVTVTPMPAGDDASSLSAILMDEEYYRFVVASRTVIEGVPIVPASCLIPLKARAWLDLTARETGGDKNVKGDDLKKHRNDVFRLWRSLAPADRFTLPERARLDMREFLARHHPGNADWPTIRQAVGSPELPDPAIILAQLRENFSLEDHTTT